MATANKMMVRAIDASYYMVKDIDKATAFYTQLLGFAPTLAVPNFISEWTFPGGETFGLYRTSDSPSGSGVMFQVDDVAGAVDLCKAFGVEFDEEGGTIEETAGCHMAFAKDPEGNRFIIHKRK